MTGDRWLTGRIKRLITNPNGSFGFLLGDNDVEYFFVANHVWCEWSYLRVGMDVTFTAGPPALKGPVAHQVGPTAEEQA